MKQSLQLRLGQQLTMTPQLQQAIKLLQLSSLDLQQEIQEALDSNVMLEVDEDQSNNSPDSETPENDFTDSDFSEKNASSSDSSHSESDSTSLKNNSQEDLSKYTKVLHILLLTLYLLFF